MSQTIEQQVAELRISIGRMESKLNEILGILQTSQKTNRRLEEHITFIERTYENLHTPLSYIRNRVLWLVGSSSKTALDHVPNKEKEEDA